MDEGWRSGVSEEIQWWWEWILRLRQDDKLANWGRMGEIHFPFDLYRSAFGDTKAVSCLNIGSGPRSDVGRRTAFKEITVMDMDPLAPAYNIMADMLQFPRMSGIQFGAIEILDQLDLPKFDFIYAKNCLDHALDVPSGLSKMSSLLATPGAICLEHYENEAEHQNYLGFHKWNLELVDGAIRIWNRETSSFFDHSARGLAFVSERRMVRKGNGVEHPMLRVWLTKGL